MVFKVLNFNSAVSLLKNKMLQIDSKLFLNLTNQAFADESNVTSILTVIKVRYSLLKFVAQTSIFKRKKNLAFLLNKNFK